MNEMNEIKKNFLDWWKNEEIVSIPVRHPSHLNSFKYKNVIDAESASNGTYCDVWQTYYQPDGSKVAIKHTSFHDYEKMTALWQEYKIHKALYDIYVKENKPAKVIKPLWIKKVAFNNGMACPHLCVGLEKIDETMYDYLKRNKKDTIESLEWKKEIIAELKRLNKEYKFSHRDCHINNIALCNGEWKLFDFGMAIMGDLQSYFNTDYSTSFFGEDKRIPSPTFDERILRFSWQGHGTKDKWVNYETKKIINSPSKFWMRAMPVVLKDCQYANNGKYAFTDENGKIFVEIKKIIKGTDIKLKTMPVSKYSKIREEKMTCKFDKSHVLPDVHDIFIHYYLPFLP